MTSVLFGLVLVFYAAMPSGLPQGKCGTPRVACPLVFPSLLDEVQVQFKITFPKPNSTVGGEVIEVEGVGAKQGDKIEISVLTNQWYVQDGTAEINEDGSWSYAPCHLSGKRQFNNHTIKARLLRNGKQIDIAKVRGVVRRNK